MINIFLDDVREPPNDGTDWVICRTASACIELICQLPLGAIDRISLDHDLGPPEAGDGYEVALWIEQEASAGKRVAKHALCHSANPVGRARIHRALESAERRLKKKEKSHEHSRPEWQ